MGIMTFAYLRACLLCSALFATTGWGFHSPAVVHRPLDRSKLPSSRALASRYAGATSTSIAVAASTPVIDDDDDDDGRTGASKKDSFPIVLWRFTRPHTIIGSALAIPALHTLAAPSYAAIWTAATARSMVVAMLPALLMNLYITGLNQVYDVEIDKINKPDLPLAAGDLSLPAGVAIVIASGILSVGLGLAEKSAGLNVALWCSGILGTLYSLPPFRLKRFPFLAAFCIVSVRGAVINAGFYAHALATAFGSASASTAPMAFVWNCLCSNTRCLLSSLYFAVFGLVIALMKDVPDVVGDEQSNIRTFSVRLGPQRVFKLMHRLLSGLFVGVGACFFRGMASTAASPAVRIGRGVVGLSALLAARSVEKESVPVDPKDSKQVYGYYMHLWKLFYLSYFVLPMAR